MFKVIMAAFVATFAMSAHAAEIYVDRYTDTGETYIVVDGETVAGDAYKFRLAIQDAKSVTDTETEQVITYDEDGNAIYSFTSKQIPVEFSRDVYLTGPGGNANEGFDMAIAARVNDLTTIAAGECVSACSTIWMGGTTRILEDDKSRVGFHLAYYPDGAYTFENHKDNFGWVGIQDLIGNLSLYSIATDFAFGIQKPMLFLLGMMEFSSHKTLFWITKENLHIIGVYPPEVIWE